MKLATRARRLESSLLAEFFKEVKRLEAKGQEIISLAVGEPYFHTPWRIKERAREALSLNQTYYTPAAGSWSLRQALVEKLNREERLKLSGENLIVSSGAKPLLNAALRCLVERGDKVVLPSPYYPPFKDLVEEYGGEVILVPTEPTFHLHQSQLAKALNDSVCQGMIINYPNNPTSVTLDSYARELIKEKVGENNWWLLSDETYQGLELLGHPQASLAAEEELKDKVVVIRSFSKLYAMTGWRVGYAFGPLELMKKMTTYLELTLNCAGSISQYAALKVTEDSFRTLLTNRRYRLKQRQAELLRWLRRQGLDPNYPAAAFYLFVDISPWLKVGESALDFAGELLRQAGVAVVPGIAFGPYPKYLRLSYAVKRQVLEEGLRRWSKFLKQRQELVGK